MKKSSPPEEFVTSSITIFENKIACQRILSFPIIFLFIGCCVGGQNEGGWRWGGGAEGDRRLCVEGKGGSKMI